MGRAPRSSGGSLLQHITTRGNDRRVIFMDDADRRAFLTMLGHTASRHDWATLGYCLMPNHVHLLAEAPAERISAGMRDLLGPYARRFHRRHGTSGHLLGSRFHNVPIEDDRQVHAVLRYLALNPVKSGLCTAAADWPWSSYRASIGGINPPGFLDLQRLWALVAREPAAARDILRALLAQS